MKLFAIFGNPINHSKSPLMHNFAFKNLNYDGVYTRYLLENAKELKDKFFKLKLSGANVTVPFKEDAYLLADEVRGVANKIQAVNTLILEDNKLIGYNTDANGFLKAISEFENVKSVLILGAGGTAKAIATILKQEDFEVVILNRSSNRLEFFKAQNIEAYTWDEFKNDKFDLIVNTTTAGLNDEELPAPKEILDKLFKSAKYAFDAIYKETAFLKLAKKNNLKVKNGFDMLLYQGVIAFDYFTNHQFSEKKITKYISKALREF